MEYMLILAADPEGWGSQASDSPSDGVIDDWGLYTRALHEAGVLVAGHGLQGADMATTVRFRDGASVLTDGPYAETKEHLIGYYIISTSDLDTALAWAAKAPNARIGSIEVRPLMPNSATDEVLKG